MSTATILVVDDDREITTLLSMLLVNAGYDVITATDANKMIDAAHRYQPDLYILDVNMPSCNGISLKNRILQMGSADHTPIIYLTGDKSDELVTEAKALGAFDVLYKPLDCAELFRRSRGFEL